MSKPLLITLLPSSGVDTSRWVLAHYDYAYTERPHAPIFHVLALKSWGLTKDQYPGLVVDGKVAAYGSKGITLHLDPQMPEEKRLMLMMRRDRQKCLRWQITQATLSAELWSIGLIGTC